MSIGIALGTYLGATGFAGYSNIPINNYVSMIGASSIAAGSDLTGLAQLVSGDDVAGVLPWSILMADGALCYGGGAATGGFTVQQIYDTHWPTIRDATPKRGFVGFYGGTNNAGFFAPAGVVDPVYIATQIEVVRDFITEARSNGQVPFICTTHPNESNAAGLAGMPAWRLALIDLCTEEGAILADTFDAVGNPATGTWDSASYTENGINTALHAGALAGPLIGQAIADALTPYRRSSHNPQFVSVGDDTDGWVWRGGLFTVDGNTNGIPDGGGTGLATDAWGSPTNDAAYSLVAGTGDVVGNWLTLTKSGTFASASTASTPTTAPGVMTLTEGDDFEVAYHVKTDSADPDIGPQLKLHSTASGSTYLFYHSFYKATYEIADKVFWALHEQPAATTMRFNNTMAVSGVGSTAMAASYAMLSIRLVGGIMAGSGTGAWYGLALDAMRKGNLELDAGTFKVMFTDSGHTPDPDAHNFRDDLTADEVTGTGLSAGGVTVTVTLDHDTANNRLRVFVSDISEATVTASDIKNAHLYKSLGGAASADPLIGYVTFDNVLAPTAGTLAVDFDGTNGFLREAY
jgi:hypothetical protein